MARPARAAFVTLLSTVLCAGLCTSSAGAVPESAQLTQQAPAVLAPVTTDGPAPTAAGVGAALAAILKDPSLGPHHGVYVYDASRGKPVFSVGTGTSYTPASTLKLLTTVSALATLGPDHTFATNVVSLGKGSIALVGGGDPLLTVKPATDYPARATLQTLAASTAKALKAQGVAAVTLGYDATLFTGPAVNTHWEANYVPEGIAAPTSALWVDEGRIAPRMAKRSASPSLAAAASFQKLLQQYGIKVAAAAKPVAAPSSAPLLAQVESPTLGQIVEYINLHSDNDGAETLLRHVGIATGNGGSYIGGVKGVRATLTKLGLDVSKATIYDGSGLTRANKVPLDLLAGAVRVAASTDHPELRHLLTGLPIAGFDGSLRERFTTAGTSFGTGLVHAKTGTLTSVHSLAGYARDRTGTLLVFAIASDSVPVPKTLDARAALDRATSALANCGC
ncbi:D-alanyl-D-alanine carboxypeptidase/D-alanyl-D-alanine-endopeptidase (penicillin-binding protein 4) [Kribbella aluminosa]|uniref:D-alanyl-D-alanine carboxypeptidase/D-alanyl-D-alanine-endopeptidase (Penicillin-binding protein 4) n=1 Tax=Kribbella aluminosa TaxID=416017 RepID=A0ABS4UCI2_9ACTN|nr:D-alanyl-D-alanine carboxypeptidase/D-alanyl-D-alanine-endopeptidase [Kribbella aluminosa]MBP2349316.1 D-alanyl-D-alanine carboxypeptidase/D-alanyl-D-alanine-endopeptidase (penicillin-binding protein 4) [Kribbella aluminosa]